MYACSKNTLIEDKYVTLSYNQTFCADPWKNLSSDSLTLVNVANYLNSYNLYIAGLNIKQVLPADSCKACTCKTGKTIYVSTFDSDSLKAKYYQIGFK
jgi:hypothetical protein